MPRAKTPPPAAKPRPGRPKTSPLDPVAQVRERQRRHRERKREEGRVAVQLWLHGKVHAAILESGRTLQDAADEAFALLLTKTCSRKAR